MMPRPESTELLEHKCVAPLSLAPLACVRLVIQARVVGGLRLGAFAGATLRGGFGHALKQLACTWPVGDCPRCSHRLACLYAQVFETSLPQASERLRGLDQIARPYVFDPWGERDDPAASPAEWSVLDPVESTRSWQWPRYQHGEAFSFSLVLVGRVVSAARELVTALAALGRSGLGAGGRFVIERVVCRKPGDAWQQGGVPQAGGPGDEHVVYSRDAAQWRQPQTTVPRRWAPRSWDGARRVVVHFCTPTRVCSEGQLRLTLSFHELVRALLRRLSSLAYFHCGGPLELDFEGLASRARAVQTVWHNLRWYRQSRYSGRQRQRVAMGGLMGSVCYEAQSAEELAPFLELLGAGMWLHVGKGAVMGLGAYVAEVA
jgi:hypothetical protein